MPPIPDIIDPASLDIIPDEMLAATEAHSLAAYGYSVDRESVDGVSSKSLPETEFRRLGPGQSYTFNLYTYPDYTKRDVTVGEGAIVETLRWHGNFHRIYQIFDPARRTIYNLSET